MPVRRSDFCEILNVLVSRDLYFDCKLEYIPDAGSSEETAYVMTGSGKADGNRISGNRSSNGTHASVCLWSIRSNVHCDIVGYKYSRAILVLEFILVFLYSFHVIILVFILYRFFLFVLNFCITECHV